MRGFGLAGLELRSVAKTYPGGIVAASGVDLTIEDGEVFVIVGPSGSGKSTLLRLVAGLESLDSGSILLGGRRIDTLAPRDRDVAMVFQDPVVYPHLDVFENIAFGLRARRKGKAEVEGLVDATAKVLGLGDCLRRKPATLSGGQRRRVALGRAMVIRPRIFLFDEPFSGLDAPLRASTRAEFVELHRQVGTTMVLVTHDQAEALALGDRVAVIDRGRIVQVGPPVEVYDRPSNRFVARFIGEPPMHFLPCLIAGEGPERAARVVGLDDLAPLSLTPKIALPETPVDLGLRPEHVTVRPVESEGLAIVRRLEPIGHEVIAELSFGPHTLATRLPSDSPIRVGDRLTIHLDLDRACWFDPATGARLG